MKLSTCINSWLKSAKIRCKKTTYSNYQYVVNAHILPKFKNVLVKNINNDLINDFTNNLLESGLKEKTVKDILIILSQIFSYSNIDIKISMPKVKRKSIQILSKEEQLLLETELFKNLNFKTLGIFVCLYTGIRIGELCALKWEDIDLINYNINIKSTITRIKNDDNKTLNKTVILIDSPKSNSSIRVIPIPGFLVKYLKRYSKGIDSSAFFLTGTVKYIEPRNYFNFYKRFMRNIGIGQYNFHALRHTFATRCVEAGFDAKLLSEILGHSNVSITLERYVHPTYDSKVIMMNKLKPLY